MKTDKESRAELNMRVIITLALSIAFFTITACQTADRVTQGTPSSPSTTPSTTLDLSGTWRWSIDPYGDGYAGFHGGEAGYGSRRYNFINVEEEMRKDPTALFEYDMATAKTTTIPGAWVGHEPEMRHYHGIVWYLKNFSLKTNPDERVFLNFGAVNYTADVYLNGKSIGKHEGGFTPFSFEITDALVDGENALTVGVDSRRNWQSVPPPVTDWETYGGITRPVTITRTPKTYIKSAWVKLATDEMIAADIQIDGPDAGNHPITLNIAELGLSMTASTDSSGRVQILARTPANLQKWSPDTPKLYHVTVQNGQETWTDKIGFRTITTKGEDILLNGKPIFLRGISVHEEELGINPMRDMSEANARALLSQVKHGLNGNFVRLAHYPHAETMTRLADEMGLIVWSEIPVYWRIDWENTETLDLAKSMIKENIMRDRNRASILFWSVGNETPISDKRNIFMNALIAQTRTLDSTRLVTAALMTSKDTQDGVLTARITDPLAQRLDVLSVNTYDGWYGPVPVDAVSEIRWDLAFNKPLIISEFGAGAYIGLSGEETPRKFSVEYQDEIYKETLEMSTHIPSLRGISPWILKDFRSPRRQHSLYQNGWNRKGVITETGERKPAFFTLSEHYAAIEKAQTNASD